MAAHNTKRKTDPKCPKNSSEEPASKQVEFKKLRQILDLNSTINWNIWTYCQTRLLFGATCKTCYESVQGLAVSQDWFHNYCPYNELRLRCRNCEQVISGLLFWQSNGVVHYGCLDKRRTHYKMTLIQEEGFKNMRWGFCIPKFNDKLSEMDNVECKRL